MTTTNQTGWRTMTAAQLLQLAADLRRMAAFMRRSLLQRAALRERRAGQVLATEMLDEGQAYALAQEIADREGETVYIHGPGELFADGYEIEPDRYCRHCGWLVAAPGVTIPAALDLPNDEAKPHRCSDTACVSCAVWSE